MKNFLRILALILCCCGAAHAQTWSGINVDLLVPMNTSSPGTPGSTTIFNAGTVCGSNCTVGSTAYWGTVPSEMSVGANQGTGSNLGPVTLNGGATYPAQSLNYNNMAEADSSQGSPIGNLQFNLSPAPTRVRILYLFNAGTPTNATSSNLSDKVMIQNLGGAYLVTQITQGCPSAGHLSFQIEMSNPLHSGNCIPVPSLPIVYVAANINYSTGAGTMWIYTQQGTLIGSDALVCTSCQSGALANIRVPSNENETDSNTSYYQNFSVEWTTAPPTGTATVTNGSPNVSLSGTYPTQSLCPNGYVDLGGTMYGILSCGSGGTSLVLNANYAGTSGTTSYDVELPLFWQRTDLAANELPPSRTASWTTAGVTGGIPDAAWPECTTTACNTVISNAGSSTEAQIEAAWASAPNDSYVYLPAGNYSVPLCLSGYSNRSLRGAYNSTVITPPSGVLCNGPATTGIGLAGSAVSNYYPASFTAANGPVAVSGMLNQGSALITLASVPNLQVGNPIILDQLDSQTDLGGVLVLGTSTSYTGTYTSPGSAGPYSSEGGTNGTRCSSGSTSPSSCYHQQQMVQVTSCNGVTTPGASCSGTNVAVGITPPLEMPNWAGSTTVGAWWGTSPVSNVGIEDLTINAVNITGSQCGGNSGIALNDVIDGWVSGVSVLNTNESHIQLNGVMNVSLTDNYLFGTEYAYTCSYGIETLGAGASQVLIENNIFHAVASPLIPNAPMSNSVMGFNFSVNQYYTDPGYNQNFEGDHSGGVDTILMEGNIGNWATGDAIHGTGNLNTKFRNLFYGLQPQCYSSGSTYATATYQNCNSGYPAEQLCAYHRFYNQIGNIFNNPIATSVYGSGAAAVIQTSGCNASVGSDPAVTTTYEFWDNWDNFTNGVRATCSDVQTFPPKGTGDSSIFASQFYLAMSCPSSTLPASFYYSSKPSWWPSGKAWPPMGPDISAGNLLLCSGGAQTEALVTSSSQCPGGTTSTAFAGQVNSNPAMDCYLSTMSGPANGVTAGPLSFSASLCYSASAGTPSAPAPWFMADDLLRFQKAAR